MRWREKNSISTSNSWKCSEKFREEERYTAIRLVDRALLVFCREYLQRVFAEDIRKECLQRILAEDIRKECLQRILAEDIRKECLQRIVAERIFAENIHQKNNYQRHDGGQTAVPRSCLFLSVPLLESSLAGEFPCRRVPVHTFCIDCCFFRL